MEKIEETIFEKPDEQPSHYSYFAKIESGEDEIHIEINNLDTNELLVDKNYSSISPSTEIYIKNIQISHSISSKKYDNLVFHIDKVVVIKNENDYVYQVNVYLDEKRLLK